MKDLGLTPLLKDYQWSKKIFEYLISGNINFITILPSNRAIEVLE
jgi:hypothetical protein